MNQSDVEKAIKSISEGVNGVIAISIVDLNSGMSLGAITNSPSFDPDVASAYNSEVVKQKLAAMKALKIDNMSVEDFLITLSDQIHIIRMTSDKQHFVYVACKKETNLAMARSVIKANCP